MSESTTNPGAVLAAQIGGNYLIVYNQLEQAEATVQEHAGDASVIYPVLISFKEAANALLHETAAFQKCVRLGVYPDDESYPSGIKKTTTASAATDGISWCISLPITPEMVKIMDNNTRRHTERTQRLGTVSSFLQEHIHQRVVGLHQVLLTQGLSLKDVERAFDEAMRAEQQASEDKAKEAESDEKAKEANSDEKAEQPESKEKA